MESALKDSLLAVCKLLDDFGVKYMLIGGTAVALNGYYRISIGADGKLTDKPDVDIWYDPTYENYYNLLTVIEKLGEDVTDFKNEKSPNPRKSFFKFEFEDFTLDILPEIKADISFREASNRKETVNLEGVDIHFMNYYDLLKDKESTARQKDIEDIKHLKKLRGES